MYRISFFILLFCSLSLNAYLFIQLSERSIENTLQQATNFYYQLGAAQVQQNIGKNENNNNNDVGSESNNTDLSQQIVNKIKSAINAKDYYKASFFINALANDHNAELPEVRLFWLHTTEALIQQKLFTDAEESISAYLAFQPDDSDFLYQQINIFQQKQQPLLAIKHAYEIQYHVFTEVENNTALNFARKLVQQQAEILINKNHWFELNSLVEEVLIFDPQNVDLQWLVARAQYQLGEFNYARDVLKPLLSQPNYKIKAQTLLADIDIALRKPESIPLVRHGEHFIVQALMNDSFNVSLMLDTGASISLLSESAFDALSQNSNVVYLEDLKLNTAGGTVTASIYQVAEFAIQGYVVNDFVFAVSPYFVNSNESTNIGKREDNDGLLGMNFLRNFDFYIDQNNNLLILKNK